MSTNARAASAGSTERSNGKRRFGGLLATIALALCALGSSAPTALATTGHAYADQFGAGGFGFASPRGVAVDQASGDVFASDPEIFSGNGYASRVTRFDSAGVLQDQNAIVLESQYYSINNLAVDPAGSGSLYVTGASVSSGQGIVRKYSTAGAFAYALDPPSGTSFSNPAGLAVDPVDGTVYVGGVSAVSAPIIFKFDNAGTYLATITGATNSPDGAFSEISSLAVDGAHHLYVLDDGKHRVDRYSPSGSWEATVDDGSHGTPNAVTADASTDQVYVAENGPQGTQIGLFSAGGAARTETFGAGHIAAAGALAVNAATGTLYVADPAQGVIERFTTFAGPTVSTEAPTGVSASEATFNGAIDPEGIEASYHFEYGLDTNYGNSTADVPVGSGNSAVPAVATAELLPNTLYHVRIVGTNASGPIAGNDVTFTTDPAPPILDSSPPQASPIEAKGATLNGTIDPRGSDTTYHFDYGKTTAYGSVSEDATTGVSQGDGLRSLPVTGLAPGTTYHFRLSADNGTGGVQHGIDQTFTTPPAIPGGATNLAPVTATLTGTLDPHGSAATYHFEYGTTIAYGLSTPEESAGSGSGNQAVTKAVNHLTPATIYHVRLVATDIATGVTTRGLDGIFITVAVPGAVTGALTGLAGSHAAFSGQFDTHGLSGTYRFFVRSTSGTYLGKTEATSIAIGAAPGNASGALEDLPAGQTYEVRLSVTSAGLTSLGDAVTFSTAPPPVLPMPPMPAGDNRPPSPSNSFGLDGKARARSAKLSVSVPGPGTIVVSGKSVKATSKQTEGAGTVALSVPLSAKSLKALRSHNLSVSVAVVFTPIGGSAAEQTLKLSFKRKAGNR